ncbi:bifunctional adenosylcobinamide kinase/adenosylcobinamide-phosphate guanylyltransferase [Vibrio paucivorans]
MTIQLVLGGARSGKSSHAEQSATSLANKKSGRLHYVATAQPFDEEMRSRIEHHKQSRGTGWIEHECPTELANLIATFEKDDVVLIDCLTLWLNNIIFASRTSTPSDEDIKSQVNGLVTSLESSDASILLVSNEVGLGVVPMGEVSRLFVDHAGWMNQALARAAHKVEFVAAGLPLVMKGDK